MRAFESLALGARARVSGQRHDHHSAQVAPCLTRLLLVEGADAVRRGSSGGVIVSWIKLRTPRARYGPRTMAGTSRNPSFALTSRGCRHSRTLPRRLTWA